MEGTPLVSEYENNLLITLFEMRVPYRFLLVKNMNEEFNIDFPLDIEERFLFIDNLIDNEYVQYVDNQYNIVQREELESLKYDVFIELTQKGGEVSEKLLDVDWTTYHDCGWGCNMSLNTANIEKLNHIKKVASRYLSNESHLKIIEENPWNATYWKQLNTTGYKIELKLTDKEFRRYFNFYSYGENKYKLPPSDLNAPTFLDEKRTISLSKRLNLKSKNTNMNWDLEFSDYRCIEEFIKFFNEEELNDDEIFSLISLIFASFDDEILNTSQMNMELFRKFVKILKVNYNLVKPILDYWISDKGNGSLGAYLKEVKNL